MQFAKDPQLDVYLNLGRRHAIYIYIYHNRWYLVFLQIRRMWFCVFCSPNDIFVAGIRSEEKEREEKGTKERGLTSSSLLFTVAWRGFVRPVAASSHLHREISCLLPRSRLPCSLASMLPGSFVERAARERSLSLPINYCAHANLIRCNLQWEGRYSKELFSGVRRVDGKGRDNEKCRYRLLAKKNIRTLAVERIN